MDWKTLTKYTVEDAVEPIANMIRNAHGDKLRNKANKQDTWDRKYHSALTKGPIRSIHCNLLGTDSAPKLMTLCR